MNWSPPEGSDNPMRMVNDNWFNIQNQSEQDCYARGQHRWGPDKFADEEGVQGYHNCRDCGRCEPL